MKLFIFSSVYLPHQQIARFTMLIYNITITTVTLLENILAALTPYSCLSCGNEGALICSGCMLSEFVDLPPQCGFCRTSSKYFATCASCRKSHLLEHIWIATDYKELARWLVTGTKYSARRAGCRIQANVIEDTLPLGLKYDLITSVPTITRHIRQRGFDHAQLIAQHLAKGRIIPYQELLHRQGQSAQLGNTRAERLRGIKGQIYVDESLDLKAKKILLVDDVLTTGATISECARVLRKAGAKSVDAAIFARA